MDIPLSVEPYDCEVCGTSYDSLTVDFQGPFWVAQLYLGCYSGDEVQGSRNDVIRWLRETCSHAVNPADMALAIQYLQEA